MLRPVRFHAVIFIFERLFYIRVSKCQNHSLLLSAPFRLQRSILMILVLKEVSFSLFCDDLSAMEVDKKHTGVQLKSKQAETVEA